MVKKAILTIDDAPSENFISKIDFLEEKGIRAIWFCNGERLEKFRDAAVEAIKRGQILANHSWDHPNFQEISLEEAEDQIARTDKLLGEIYKEAGVNWAVKLFRFPFLNCGDNPSSMDTNWEDPHVKGIQNILAKYGYVKYEMPGLNFKYYKDAGMMDCINMDCTYDTFDWVIETDFTHGKYVDLETCLARIDEERPEEGSGLNWDGSNEIVMQHAWVVDHGFKALIEKMSTKKLEWVHPLEIAGIDY